MILIYEKENEARVITRHGMHTYLFTAWMTLGMVLVMAHNST